MMLEPAMEIAPTSGRSTKPERLEDAGGDRQREAVVADRPGEVLVHLAHGAAADGDGGGDVERVGAHQHDVGGLDGDVGAGADRDADVGLGERGGVVDAVADHGDLAALAAGAR